MNASLPRLLISIVPSEVRCVLNVVPTFHDTSTSFKHGPSCERFFVFCDCNVQVFPIVQCHGELAVSFYLGVFKYTIGTVISKHVVQSFGTVPNLCLFRLWHYVISLSVKDELL